MHLVNGWWVVAFFTCLFCWCINYSIYEYNKHDSLQFGFCNWCLIFGCCYWYFYLLQKKCMNRLYFQTQNFRRCFLIYYTYNWIAFSHWKGHLLCFWIWTRSRFRSCSLFLYLYFYLKKKLQIVFALYDSQNAQWFTQSVFQCFFFYIECGWFFCQKKERLFALVHSTVFSIHINKNYYSQHLYEWDFFQFFSLTFQYPEIKQKTRKK